MVEIEKLPDGRWRVSRVLPNAGAMQASASALERVCPEAFEPGKVERHGRGGPLMVRGWDGIAAPLESSTIELRD